MLQFHLKVVRGSLQFFLLIVGGCRLLDPAHAGAGERQVRDSRWNAGDGDWADEAKWSNQLPDVWSRAALHGKSDVRLPKGSSITGVGALRIGILANDQVRFVIDGGRLVCRRDFLNVGEATGSSGEIVLNDGALQCVTAVYLGGTGSARVGASQAVLRIRGGSFVARLATLGWGHRADATLAIEGSKATAVHLLDYVTMGVPGATGEPSTSTLAFTLDARGVTPITIQSKQYGLHIARKLAENKCRLRIALAAVPPRDDITLIAAHVPTRGAFDDLPDGSEVRADHAGRTYCWTLTYRGGPGKCNVVLTNVKGHADGTVTEKCRAIPKPPTPLWEGLPAHAQTDDPKVPLAFDGAEGFGRHAAGGRGGRTISVDNLNDSGPGSFRAAAMAKGPRIVQFRVGGEIVLRAPIRFVEPFLTVDGSSAPKGGITFVGDGFVVQTHDVILRHFRIRPGDNTDDTDALSFYDAQRCIADHLSLSWATDEVLSITGLSDRITVQWCIISEGLNRAKHGYASIAAGERATWHHNLFAHHISRVPRFAGITHTDFRNNVLYDWGHTAGYGQFERLNYAGNYLKPGPSTTQRPSLIHNGDSVVGERSLFLEGNHIHGDEAATRENWKSVGYEPSVRADRPFAAPNVRMEKAEGAFESVLKQAGAFAPRRDATDERVVRQVRTGTGGLINSVRDVGRHEPLRIETTLVDANAISGGTYQSHNQKVVQNGRGIFMTHLRSRNEEYTSQQWRLSWSKDGGRSFKTLYEATNPTNPPVLETDSKDNLYVAWPDFVTLKIYVYRFLSSEDYRTPHVTEIPKGAAGKYALALDEKRGHLYYFSHNGTFHRVKLDGTYLDSRLLTKPGPKATLVYPSLQLDGETLHAGWTTLHVPIRRYWAIHHAQSADGGDSWTNFSGKKLALPIIGDETGPADRITLDDEFDPSTWLSSMLIRDGKAHFLYLARTEPPRQHHVRMDIATGKREIDHKEPSLKGDQLALRSLDGLWTAKLGKKGSPLFCVASNEKHDRLVCLVSRDAGKTWIDYAVSDKVNQPYAIGGARGITSDSYIIGSFTELEGTEIKKMRGGRVWFYKIKAV